MSLAENPFEDFFRNPVYLSFKNHLYNYQLRRSAIRSALKQSGPQDLVLEIGSGVSTMADGLGKVLFSDISEEAMRYLREKNVSRLESVMSVTHIALKDAKVPCIVCSEVLEHVPDDTKALKEFARVMKPGGKLILTVPAQQRFFGPDDVFVEHVRRYDVAPFVKQIENAGFEKVEVVKVTGLLDKLAMLTLTWLYPLFALKKKGENRKASSIRVFVLTLLLPFYILLNWIFALLVTVEAKLMPLSTTAVIMVKAVRK